MEETTTNICTQLGNLIRTTLSPLVADEYIYLDLPYYSNVGDILIWKGTEAFLEELPSKCLGKHSKDSFDFRPLPKNCTILLQGGGNFGDLWRSHQEFRLKIIQSYPKNPIIVLPQTVYYESGNTFANDVRTMNQHSHLTICARDTHSAELLKEKGFTGKILLLPDMAFCINPEELQADAAQEKEGSLILFRKDKELKEPTSHNKYLQAAVSDWPQMQKDEDEAWQYLKTHKKKEVDAFFIDQFFPRLIKSGVEFASSYDEVCSTRLHVAILRILLGLPVEIVDNSYGKNSSFYNTWLKESPLVTIPDKREQDKIEQAIYLHKQGRECKHKLAKFANLQQRQENEIASLSQSLKFETAKHRKYRKLFVWLLSALICETLALLLLIIVSAI